MTNPEDDQYFPEPSIDAVKDIFSSSWPTFVPVPKHQADGHLGVIWSRAEKGTSMSEVQLNPDLIEALEKASEVNEA